MFKSRKKNAEATNTPRARHRRDLESIAEALDAALSIHSDVNRLILGYALVAAIVAALPAVIWFYEVKLGAVVILNLLMIRSIGRSWGYSRGQSALTRVFAVLGVIGAVAMTGMVFVIVFSASLYVPIVRSWAEAAAYFALTMSIGRVSNEYFQNAQHVDRRRLVRVLRARRELQEEEEQERRGKEPEDEARDRFRRRALLAGLGGSLGVGSLMDYRRWRESRAEPIAEPGFDDLFEATYAQEAAWQEDMSERFALMRNVSLRSPEEPYHRELARQMIFACRLAVMQFRAGESSPSFDGDVTGLEELDWDFEEPEAMTGFRERLRGFRDFFGVGEQRATFVAEQESVEQYLQVLNPPRDDLPRSPVQRFMRPIENVIYEAVPKLARQRYRKRVYVGYVLETERANIIVFRGTQTTAEWINNLRSQQRPLDLPGVRAPLGWVHGGFLRMSDNIQPSPLEIAATLDPSKPCYITGHSLGSALATLWAFRLALRLPELAEQIRVFSFGGPRVGDETFAKTYSDVLPNTYRIVNLTDSVPLVPGPTMGRHFLHVGKEVAFVSKFDDLLLNHVVDTYERALNRGVEAPGPPKQLRVLTVEDRI